MMNEIQRILEIEAKRKFGITRLARKMGVTNRTIYNWREKKSEPNYKNYKKLIEIHRENEILQNNL